MKNIDMTAKNIQADVEPNTQVQEETPLDVGFRYSEAARGALEQQGVSVPRREGLVTAVRVLGAAAVAYPLASFFGGVKAYAADSAVGNVAGIGKVKNGVVNFVDQLNFVSVSDFQRFRHPAREYTTFEVTMKADLGVNSTIWHNKTPDKYEIDSFLVGLPRNVLPTAGKYSEEPQVFNSAEVSIRNSPTEPYVPAQGKVIEGTNGNFALQIMGNRAHFASTEVLLNFTMTQSIVNLAKASNGSIVGPIPPEFVNEHDTLLKGVEWCRQFGESAYLNSFIALAKERGLLYSDGYSQNLTETEKFKQLIAAVDRFTNPASMHLADPAEVLRTGIGNCLALTQMFQALCALNNLPNHHQSGMIGSATKELGGGGFYNTGHSWCVVFVPGLGPVSVDLTLKGDSRGDVISNFGQFPHFGTIRGDRVSYPLRARQSVPESQVSPFLVTPTTGRASGMVIGVDHAESSCRIIG